LVAPVVDLVVQGGAREPVALPRGEVGVLDRGDRQVGLLAAQRCRVAGGQLLGDEAHRPAVGDDVVHGEAEGVVVRGQAQQPRPYRRGLGQVESDGALPGQRRGELLLVRDVGHRKVHWGR
jgi:hypothetical protein